ncbi:MAG: glycosyltransferase family 2 protein [Sulfitobacter sp.]|nr:glycosyltransferase family 2 protein [Sulfitobacter sp.]
MSHLALLTVRNEGAFLLEWLAHHRAVGFDHVLVYSNDCTDGTDAMLDHIAQEGWLTHVPNPGPYDRRGVQFTALKAAARHPALKAADWILPLDIDEFVNIHVGDHTLSALHAALPRATAITLTWRLFGSAGRPRFTDAPVTDTFTRCAPEVLYWPWRAAMFKTLYRNDGTYAKPGVHRPRAPDPNRLPQAHWYDGAGRALPEAYRTGRIFSPFGQPNYALAQLNHYALGDMESFLLKADRGRAVHADHPLGMDYWTDRNFNSDEDRSIASLAPARDAELARLRADPVLADLHSRATTWRRTRFAELLAEDHFRALYGRLLMTPSTQPLPQKTARFLLDQALAAQRKSAE